ncbi:MAG: DUF1553 domain-containing protein [Acidobacteria bacterium]|nr:DUF1553 domain-containing protein [Acidobacteriota bacterium]
MPPGAPLPAAELSRIESWVAAGAPWADSAPLPTKPVPWSFRKLTRPPLPEVRQAPWVRSPIDRFILQRLERAGIQPAPEAEPVTLARRLALDLTGLPPTPDQLSAFLNDRSPQAYERLADSLLASPHFGERWGRHWLDQARYADSDGGSRDEPRHIWRYRQWVIGALNRDLPFDQFIIEQIAGDLLPNPTTDQLIATGFHRNSPLQIEAGTDREQYRAEAVADRVDTTGTVFLGLSLGCARCHDHKYDPITQKEYYQLYAFFNNLDEYGPALPPFSETNDLDITHAPLQPLGPRDVNDKWTALRAQLLALHKERFAYRGGELSGRAKNAGDEVRTATITALRKQLPPVELVMVMREMETPRETFIQLGGDYLRHGQKVAAGLPAALVPAPSQGPLNRLHLARWLANPDNPLVSRVAVNRIWQQYFGRGLVDTENDFGAQGAKPSHPELLDWLATEFQARGWSQKTLHKTIVMSAAYRQSSAARPDIEERDPANELLARQTRLRLEAEIVRDSALAASGLLHRAVGGRSVYPPQPAGVMETGQVKQTWNTSTGADRYRRGLYTFHYRNTPNPAMKVFDAANGLAPCTRRPRTTTPLQALTLLNDPNFHEMAVALARNIVEAPAAERIHRAYRLTVARHPSAREAARIGELLQAERDAFLTRPAEAEQLAGKGASADLAAWAAVARVLLNTDEFITRE